MLNANKETALSVNVALEDAVTEASNIAIDFAEEARDNASNYRDPVGDCALGLADCIREQFGYLNDGFSGPVVEWILSKARTVFYAQWIGMDKACFKPVFTINQPNLHTLDEDDIFPKNTAWEKVVRMLDGCADHSLTTPIVLYRHELNTDQSIWETQIVWQAGGFVVDKLAEQIVS